MSNKTEILNATISDVFVGIEDHGIMTVSVTLDYGDSGFQAFGGYCLFSMPRYLSGKPGADYTGWFIQRMVEVAGVMEVKKMIGRNVRVHREERMIVGIGHITREEWMFPKQEFEERY